MLIIVKLAIILNYIFSADGLQCYQCPKWTGVSDCYQNGDDYGELTTCPAGVTTCYNNWSSKQI